MAKSIKPDKNSAGGSGNSSSAKEECPILKWIHVTMTRKPRNEQPAWWPKDTSLPYKYEFFKMKVPNGTVTHWLSSGGGVDFYRIPPGSCTFTSINFYKEIEDWVAEEKAKWKKEEDEKKAKKPK